MRNCHYHDKPIAYFCTHLKCTLPLCEVCLPIHSREMVYHHTHQPENIQTYSQTKTQAIEWLEEKKKYWQSVENSLSEVMEEKKKQILLQISTQLAELEKRILEHLQTVRKKQIISQKQNYIEQGSLKFLIQTFEKINTPKQNPPFLELIHQIKYDHLENNVSATIKKALLIPLNLLPEKETQPEKTFPVNKKGFQLCKQLDISSVKSDFYKVINTKDVYMNSPRTCTTWDNKKWAGTSSISPSAF